MALRLLSLSLLTLANTCLRAQNLVPNGNLDSMNTCTEHHYTCCPKGWFYCALQADGTYQKLRGADFTLWHILTYRAANKESSTRQYWQTWLLCPLKPGARYHVRIKITANGFDPNLHDIGFYFTDRLVFSQTDTLLQPANYLGFMDASVTNLPLGWFQLQKDFTATGNGQALIIGNFSPESNKRILRERGKKTIDMILTDIDITPVDSTTCPDYQRTEDALFAITDRHTRFSMAHIKAAPPAPTHIDTLRIPDIDFESNSYHLTDTTILQRQHTLLENKGISHILVAGFTDDKGTGTYNLTLSRQRAEEVARLLSRQFDLPPSLITAEGRGISHQYKNDAANRRVEIYLYH